MRLKTLCGLAIFMVAPQLLAQQTEPCDEACKTQKIARENLDARRGRSAKNGSKPSGIVPQVNKTVVPASMPVTTPAPLLTTGNGRDPIIDGPKSNDELEAHIRASNVDTSVIRERKFTEVDRRDSKASAGVTNAPVKTDTPKADPPKATASVPTPPKDDPKPKKKATWVDVAGHALSYEPMNLDLVRKAIASCERGRQPKTLRVKCKEWLARGISYPPGIHINNFTELRKYAETWIERDCKVGDSVYLGRLVRGRVKLDYKRTCREGETWIGDPQSGWALMSGLCVNPPWKQPSVRMFFPPPAPPAPPPAPATAPPAPRVVFVPAPAPAVQPAPIMVVKNQKSWMGKNWPWVTALTAGAGYLGYMCATDWCDRDVDQKTTVIVNGQVVTSGSRGVGFNFSFR